MNMVFAFSREDIEDFINSRIEYHTGGNPSCDIEQWRLEDDTLVVEIKLR